MCQPSPRQPLHGVCLVNDTTQTQVFRKYQFLPVFIYCRDQIEFFDQTKKYQTTRDTVAFILFSDFQQKLVSST